MSCFEKKMAEFTMIFLHNPSECYKCSASVQRSIKSNKSEDSDLPQKKLVRNINKSYQTSFPVKDISNKPEDKLPNETGGKRDSQFKRPFDKFISCPDTSPKKAKSEKKIHLKNISPQTEKSCRKRYVKTGKKSKDEGSDKSPAAKKQSNSCKKGDEPKTPGKGTLKRKRWYFNKLNNSNDNYEDDIFENEQFGHFQNLLEDETDSCEPYEGLKTPVFPFSTSPRVESPSPTYKDCYSPTELSNSRKEAEEYQHRMNSRRKNLFRDMKKKDSPKPKIDKKKNSDVQKTLEEVARILNERQNMLDKSDSEDDDDYFSDLLNASPTVVS